MTLHYLRHVSYETPGHIEEWAERREIERTTTNLFQKQNLPEPDRDDLIVVLGGPMSVYREENPPWLSREKTFLNECLHSGIKMVGICLGAQLIADQLGADVYPMDGNEQGWAPVSWTDTALNHPMFQHFPKQHRVFHWHGDTYSLPDSALHLAESERCDQQAFLVPDRALGLQFHLEITPSIIRALIERSNQDHLSNEPPEDSSTIPTPLMKENHERMDTLLDKFVRS